MDATNLFRLGLSHVRQKHSSKYRRPRAEEDLVAVEYPALALHLHVSEVFRVEDRLQVQTELLLLPVLRLQTADGFLGIFGA